MAQFRGYTITQNFGVKNSGYRLGYHPGTDLSFGLGAHQPAFASGIARFYYAPPTANPRNRGSGYGNTGTITLDNGDVLYYAHLRDNGILVANGSRVSNGQATFVTGDTGWIEGVHCHVEYRIKGSQDNPVDITKKLTNTAPPSQGGNEVVTLEIGRILGYSILGRLNALDGAQDADINKNHVGANTDKKIWEFYNSSEGKRWREQSLPLYIQKAAERDAYAAQVTALQTALQNEQNKPPKEIIKEIEKIVEVPVEVIVEKPVDEKEVVTNWFKRIWNSLFNKK